MAQRITFKNPQYGNVSAKQFGYSIPSEGELFREGSYSGQKNQYKLFKRQNGQIAPVMANGLPVYLNTKTNQIYTIGRYGGIKQLGKAPTGISGYNMANIAQAMRKKLRAQSGITGYNKQGIDWQMVLKDFQQAATPLAATETNLTPGQAQEAGLTPIPKYTGLGGAHGFLGQANPVATPTALTKYTIQKGDTLSALAQKYGTSVSALMQANPQIKNPNLIYAGASLNIPSSVPAAGGQPGTQTGAQAGGQAGGQTEGGNADVIAKWNDYLNNYLNNVSKTKSEVPLTGMPEKPATPDLTSEYNTLKTEQGVGPLENQLNDINARIDNLNALYEKAISEEDKRLAPMAIIRKRQAALSQQQQNELRDLTRQKNALVDQLNTKYNAINTIMDLKKQDYQTVRENYEWEYNKAFQVYQQMENQANKDQQTAKANWQTLINSIKGIPYSKLPEDFKLNLKKLEMAWGAPAGISELALQGKSDKTIKYTKSDNGKVFILYDDGTSEIRDMGGVGETEQSFFTKTDYKKLAGIGAPRDVADTISVALQEGLSLEAIRRALAEEYGKEKGYHYLDIVMSYIQKSKSDNGNPHIGD